MKNNITNIDIALFVSIQMFQKNHDAGWYMNGGCYEFALAISIVLERLKQSFKIWTFGEDLHMVIEFNNHFWDIMGDGEKLEDKENELYSDAGKITEWKQIDLKYLECCVEKNNAEEIANEIYNNFPLSH